MPLSNESRYQCHGEARGCHRTLARRRTGNLKFGPYRSGGRRLTPAAPAGQGISSHCQWFQVGLGPQATVTVSPAVGWSSGFIQATGSELGELERLRSSSFKLPPEASGLSLRRCRGPGFRRLSAATDDSDRSKSYVFALQINACFRVTGICAMLSNLCKPMLRHHVIQI